MQAEQLYIIGQWLYFYFFQINMPMRFEYVTLNTLWYICSATGVIIIKNTFFISVKNLFILIRRDINFILNVVIQIMQLIKSLLCFLYFVRTIFFFIRFSLCIIQLWLQCDFIMFRRIRKKYTICTYKSYILPNINIRKFLSQQIWKVYQLQKGRGSWTYGNQ